MSFVREAFKVDEEDGWKSGEGESFRGWAECFAFGTMPIVYWLGR